MGDKGRGAVLVVEDDPSIRALLVEALEHEAIEAVSASNGEEAVRIALEWRPAVVILDIGLPFIDGTIVAARIRDAYGDSVPLIVVTAASRIDEAASAVRAVSYVAKPFDIDDLLRAVRSALDFASQAPAPAPASVPNPSVA